jgi:dTDP-4-dehydrorhamnose reductase
MKRIYIAGCGGMLGDAFYKIFQGEFELRCTDIDINSSWLSYLDFRDYGAYRDDVLKYKPDYLFHLGAFTDLEFCENHVDDTYITNTLAVENACYIANELNIPLLYISTAGIYDGEKDVYDDWDRPNPLGHYARSKYAGELVVQSAVKKHLICRAGWMMGGGPSKDKKFINKIMQQLLNGQKELQIVNDKFGTPTYTLDFASNVKLLLQKEYWGLYNMVCDGVTSRLEVVYELLRLLDLKQLIKVTEVSSNHFKDVYFADRPKSERLISLKLNLRGVNIMRHWKVGLNEYINDEYKSLIKAKFSA